MARKRNSKQSRQVYSQPLPVKLSTELYGPLPSIFPHNPLSWIYFGFFYLKCIIRSSPQSTITPIKVHLLVDGTFGVYDDADMLQLWQQGFFGKGTLSRSDPTWRERTNTRLQTQGIAALTLEDVTRKRRMERSAFKLQRALLQELEMKARQNIITEAESLQLEAQKLKVAAMRKQTPDNNENSNNDNNDNNAKELVFSEYKELLDIIDQEKHTVVKNLEFLQLQPIEAFFLQFGLEAIDIIRDSSKHMNVWDTFVYCCEQHTGGLIPENKFILDYVTYHHFRSHGWCVRSGIKFGCDMLLYVRGPPFSHAEHAITVILNDGSHNVDWFDMGTLARIIHGVKKNLLLVYVDVPLKEYFKLVVENDQLSDREKILKLLMSYKVTEVIYRRWVPNRTRD
ncbi:tRNA splicing endonuclease subunit sen2 [Scheffersomyces spartinae]|uniref:tRNA-splicing endonuclease subunit Sen2 n=1 Tax=Scheffersomyces spartinae TaxID=45513 RepID=A0A9P7VA91_9ASCO|nr:tRNA splicing endonuclease subunit sen2 [Scheffersomyces spartinae]KAG7193703.1 tRNA splicing endonuclease subunit sen2 [Scheffersomyces spartinae]